VRVLPIPGSPTSTTSRPSPASAASSSARIASSSAWRPTKRVPCAAGIVARLDPPGSGVGATIIHGQRGPQERSDRR
jgi:hypothetical protein